MKIRKRDRPYFVNLLLAVDQFISAIFGYNADVSVSAMLGEVQWTEYNGRNIGWISPVKASLQRLLDKTQKHHCLRSYKYELFNRGRLGVVHEIEQFMHDNK